MIPYVESTYLVYIVILKEYLEKYVNDGIIFGYVYRK
jgi:hypothetical protein